MSPSNFHFLFVWDRRNRSFVERFWLEPDTNEDLVGPPDLDEMDGALSPVAARALGDHLRDDYPEPDYVVARAQGETWAAVARGFEAQQAL